MQKITHVLLWEKNGITSDFFSTKDGCIEMKERIAGTEGLHLLAIAKLTDVYAPHLNKPLYR